MDAKDHYSANFTYISLFHVQNTVVEIKIYARTVGRKVTDGIKIC